MTAQIIQFGKPNVVAHGKVEHGRDVGVLLDSINRALTQNAPATLPDVGCETDPPVKTTITARNAHMRLERRKAWWNADCATAYWRTLIDFDSAVSSAAKGGLHEACLHSRDFNEEARWRHLDNYRKAVCRQILTPAPSTEAVNWKRTHLKKAIFGDVKRERLERAIADDVAFLKAHPTRKHAATRGGCKP